MTTQELHAAVSDCFFAAIGTDWEHNIEVIVTELIQGYEILPSQLSAFWTSQADPAKFVAQPNSDLPDWPRCPWWASNLEVAKECCAAHAEHND